MSAENPESYDVLLMINQESGVLYPCSSHAFHFAQGTLKSIVGRSYGNVFLDSLGSINEIRQIRPVNSRSYAGMKRLIGFPYAIDVEWKTRAIELDEFKRLVLKGLQLYRSTLDAEENWTIALCPFPEAEAAILKAGNTRSLYNALALPGAEDCLDLL